MNLVEIISKIDLDAEWFGLREYKENTTYHVIRDKNPLSNETSIDHGIMVEVLKNGQFGYCATSDLSLSGIQRAATTAQQSAERASKYSVFSFESKNIIYQEDIFGGELCHVVEIMRCFCVLTALVCIIVLANHCCKKVSAAPFAHFICTETRGIGQGFKTTW